MSDVVVTDGGAEAEAAPGADAASAAVHELREVKYVQNIGRFEKGQSVANAAFGPCTLVFWRKRMG